eukprot:6489512-Amphidinium_carterae.1
MASKLVPQAQTFTCTVTNASGATLWVMEDVLFRKIPGDCCALRTRSWVLASVGMLDALAEIFRVCGSQVLPEQIQKALAATKAKVCHVCVREAQLRLRF